MCVRSFIAKISRRRENFGGAKVFEKKVWAAAILFVQNSSKSEPSSRFLSQWKFETFARHLLANSADRPRIWTNREQIRPNPGMIGQIRQKMACASFELQTTQKSRGWLRFRRFLDEKDRGGPNFFFQNSRAAEIFASPKNFRDERAKAHANERTNERPSVQVATYYELSFRKRH